MSQHSRKSGWMVLAGVLVACFLLRHPCADAIFSTRLALDLKKLASGASGQNLAVKETKLRRSFNGREYEAMLYNPEKTPATAAVVLIHGLSELGCYHPRAVALSRFLANRGLLVITPDIREFRDFQISAQPIEQILLWYRQVQRLKEGRSVSKTGIGGISFSGTTALMAAARPEIRYDVDFVAAIGSYCNLMRCTEVWFAPAQGPPAANYPTRFYAKWIVMRAALDMITESKERLFLRDVLDSLLLQRSVPSANPRLSPQSTRWYALATMAEDKSDPELTAQIKDHLVSRIYPQLNPEKALGEIRCPVFLVHGEQDDLIPATESRDLHRKIPGSHLLISPFMTHTHPNDSRITFGGTLRAALNTVVFFYRFAQAAQ